MRAQAGFVVAMFAGCASAPRATFEATAAYSPKAGPPPPVITLASQLPGRRLRSVGIVRVKAESREQAARDARSKGAELGCQYLIEHALFVRDGERVEVGFGAHVYLAHGSMSVHTEHARPRSAYAFDCAFEVASPSAWSLSRR